MSLNSTDQGIPERIADGFVRDQLILGGAGGFEISPDPSRVPAIPLDHLLVVEIQDVFNLSGFERPRTPLVVGQGSLADVPEPTDIHNVPLKFPGTEYRIPQELAYLEDMLTTCASVEQAINPNHDDYYAYLTLERTWVEKGLTQRTPKIHSDGLQGARVQPKVRTEHGYLLADDYPPEFFAHPFDMTGIDVNVHDMDMVYAAQAQEEATVSFGPEDIVLFDSYNLHRARQATRSGVRGFFRVTYADPARQFDRQGNTVNTLFSDEYHTHGWEFQKRGKVTLSPPPNLRH